MNEAASSPRSLLAWRRARLRARPSGLKDRCRDRCATGHSPPLTPEPLRPSPRSNTGRRRALPAGRAAPSTTNQDQNPYNQVSTVSGDCHGADPA